MKQWYALYVSLYSYEDTKEIAKISPICFAIFMITPLLHINTTLKLIHLKGFEVM